MTEQITKLRELTCFKISCLEREYSECPKSERSDFAAFQFGSFAKQFFFRHTPKTKRFFFRSVAKLDIFIYKIYKTV